MTDGTDVKAGWYEVPGEPGKKRYWDGREWGEYWFDEDDPSKEKQLEKQFEPNLAAVGLAAIAGVVAIISVFLPQLESSTFARIEGNSMIQNGEGWLIILFAVGVLAGAYKAYANKHRTWVVAVFGALIIAAAIYNGTGSRTELHSVTQAFGQNVTVHGKAGVGIYAAGVAGALALLSGISLAVGGTILDAVGPKNTETKVCPDCAETILAAARVCKHCGHEFSPGPTAGTS